MNNEEIKELRELIGQKDTNTIDKLLKKGFDINTLLDGSTMLMHAASEGWGSLEMTKYFMQHGADVNVKDEHGRTAILLAREMPIIEYLVDNGADISVQDTLEGQSLLWRFTCNGTVDEMQYIINKGFDVNTPNKYGRTCLYAAYYFGYSAKIRCLVKNGADVNITVEGQTVIMDKCRKQSEYFKIVNFLIECGLNINIKDSDGWNAAIYQLNYNYPDIALHLLKHPTHEKIDTDLANLLLVYGAKAGSLECITIALENGASINVLNQKGQKNNFSDNEVLSQGATALMICSNISIAEYLLSNGADINARDNAGRTALMRCKNIEICKLLVHNGADVNQKADGDWNAVKNACEEGNFDMVKFLFDQGIDVKAPENHNLLNSCFHYSPNYDIANYLLEKDANIHTKMLYGNNVLMRSMSRGKCNIQFAKTLLKKGIDLSETNDYGQTALIVAAKEMCPKMVKLLIEKKMDVNHKDKEGKNALIYGISEAVNYEIVQLLLENGADIDSADNEGNTPLMHAVMKYNYTGMNLIIELLLDNGADFKVQNKNGQTAYGIIKDDKYADIKESFIKRGMAI